MNNNLLNNKSWTGCYQASDTNIIGYAVGSLSSSSWVGGTPALWDYDYNLNIAFWNTGFTVKQTWAGGGPGGKSVNTVLYLPCHYYCSACSA